MLVSPTSQACMFIGEYTHNLDDKGRLAIPKKFRAALEAGAVVTRGLDACLFVYTLAEWQKLAEHSANFFYRGFAGNIIRIAETKLVAGRQNCF